MKSLKFGGLLTTHTMVAVAPLFKKKYYLWDLLVFVGVFLAVLGTFDGLKSPLSVKPKFVLSPHPKKYGGCPFDPRLSFTNVPEVCSNKKCQFILD